MSLENILQKDLVSCAPDASVKQVAQMMDKSDVGAVVVVDNNKPVGIVTDRDIVLRCVVDDADSDLVKARDIMSNSIATVHAKDGLFDAIKCMKKHEVRRVPVINDDGTAVGLVSFGDLFQLLSRELYDLSAAASPDDPKIVDHVA
jgi:CBS domain-containing protein